MKPASDPETDLDAIMVALGLSEMQVGGRTGEREFDDAVAYWEHRLEPLTGIAAPVPPSAELWDRIASAVGFAGADVRPPARRPTKLVDWWSSLPAWRFAATAAATCAALLAIALLWSTPRPGPNAAAYVAVLLAPDGKRETGWVVEVARNGGVRLIPLVQTTVASGRALQFWTKADHQPAPDSLGLVTDNTITTMPPSAVPPVTTDQLFEITLEPAGGSPIGRPTGPVLYAGRTIAK